MNERLKFTSCRRTNSHCFKLFLTVTLFYVILCLNLFQSYCLVHLYGMLVANYRPFAVFIIIKIRLTFVACEIQSE